MVCFLWRHEIKHFQHFRWILFWALSLVGRALALHARGQGFDSPRVQILIKGRWQSGQLHQTVNLTPHGYVGSNPTLPKSCVPIVQWIEQQPSKLWIQVRSLVGIYEKLLTNGLSWSSGLGRHPLTVEIEGSSPSGSD